MEDIGLVDELDALAGGHDKFRFQITLSQPPEVPRRAARAHHRIGAALLETLRGKSYCLVGNGAMIEEMSTCLSDLGVDELSIYRRGVLQRDVPG